MNDEAGPDPLLGKSLSNYNIVERLGAGGMGVVYKAIDEKLGRYVALKFLPAHSTGGSARRRFLQEARAASALDHPNIGVIHGIEETPQGELYIVMAYYEGEPLAQRLKRGALDPAQTVEICFQIAKALAEAHSKGIVHRDVKPGNVMLTRQETVKLLDFGLARLADSDSETLTRSGVAIGTPSYMAPEQALGQRSDHRSDLWSLGVVLFEMLAGQRPFVRNNTPSTLLAIVNDSAPPLEQAPPALQAIVFRCLAKDPAQRYQRAQQLVDDLAPLRAPRDAPTQTLTTTAGELARARASASAQAPGLRNRLAGWRLAAIIAVAASVAVVAWVCGASVWRGGLPVPAEKHVVVLPFTNVGDDASIGAIRDGILETLTSRLSSLERLQASLWVAPASEVRRRNVSDAAAAQRLFGANLVVTGSVQRGRDGVRLTLNLIDAKTLRQLGAAVIDDRFADFSTLQDNAVAQLARLLEVEIRPEALATINGETAAAHAYESYLKGLSFLQRYDKPENLATAIQLLEAAVKADPRFALAYARLAEAEFLKSQASGDIRLLDRALEDGNRAAAINSQLAPVHVTLGRIHAGSGKIDLAAQEFQRALEADPRSAEAHQWIARTYESQGRTADAEASLKKAVALRPGYWEGYNNLGAFYYRRAKYPDAAAQFRRVIELTPDNATAYINLGVMLNNLKDPAGAAKAYEKSIAIAPNYAAYSNLAVLYYNDGNYTRSAETYKKALQMNDRDYRTWGGIALAYTAAGLSAQARSALERAAKLAEEALLKNPTDSSLLSYLASYCAKLGAPGKARDRIQTALALAPNDQRVLYTASLVYDALGNRAEALKWLKSALSHGYPLASVERDPDASRLRQDPAFQDLLK